MCENTISMYRAVLASRAKIIPGCPKGELIARRTTSTGSIAKKYAIDCFALQTFVYDNDPKVLNETFYKKKYSCKLENTPQKSQSLESTKTFISEIAELKSVVDLLKQDLSELKRECIKSSDKIKILESEVKTLKSNMNACKCNSVSCENTMPPANCSKQNKTSKTDCRNKILLYSDVVNDNAKTTSCQASSMKTKSDSTQSANLPETSSDRNSESTISFNRDKNRFERVPANPRSNSPTLISHTDNNDQTMKKHKLNTNYDHGTISGTYDKQKERYNEGNLIPVHISNGRDKVNTIPEHTRESTSLNAKGQYDITDTDNTQRYEHDQPSNEPIFQSVGSKRTTRYYVGGIAPVSNRAGIVQYLRERGIKPIGLRMINTYNGDLAAKLTIESHDCDTIEHRRFWPRKED
ncbi:hypothetical protein ACF0H5_015971 [Mactra antiquata]